MSSSFDPAVYEAASQKVAAQAEQVRALKQAKADKAQLEAAVELLKKLKVEQAAAQPPVVVDKEKELRRGLEDLLLRRFFYVPAFEIYGGVGGLYDFGPMGCAVKQNLIAFWRQHFVLQEQMLEVDCAAMTPEPVLVASGHVAKFADFMVRDEKTGDCHRADKLLEDAMDKLLEDAKSPPSAEQRAEYLLVRTEAGAMKQDELSSCLKKYGVKSPDTGNELSEPQPYNLMFKTQIGPTGKFTGYLRPETAQGIFVNFRRLLDFNAGRMPFAAAQIGLAFRNEIAPRAGLLRVREFTLAEIEHFVNPNDKRHAKFKDVSSMKLSLLGRAQQTGEDIPVQMTAGEAVAAGIINNETLAYFLCRTQLFLFSVGIKADKLRFRQHKADEMAHYAADCWDAEINGSYGWVECVGHADRSAFDLEVHTKHSKVELIAQDVYPEPKLVEHASMMVNMPKVGATFSKGADPAAKHVIAALKALEAPVKKAQALQLKAQLEAEGKAVVQVENSAGQCVDVPIEADMVKISLATKKISSEKYTPSVIEPSFGLGRILYHILEHSYYVRPEDEQRGVLGLSPIIAGHKVAVLPLSANDKFEPFISEISGLLTAANLSSRVDNSGAALGKRYARTDEIGVPFAVTIDFQTVEDRTVTIRERDSTQQIRVKIEDIVSIVQPLVFQTSTWAVAYGKYPQVVRSDE